jgi:tetratricopeptide (TPR) repeat protein
MTYNALGKYHEAKKCLEVSSNASSSIGNRQGEISQLQALGNVYRNLEEFESAIRVYKKAVLLAEKEDLFGLSTSLGNMASIYTHLGQPDEALRCLDRGLKIAVHIGNKQSEGSMMCSIGIAYYQKGESIKAIAFIHESIKTTRLIGDRQGECMALLNLSNIYFHLEDFDKCIENAEASLKIANSISSKQSEGGALYNIGSSYLFMGDSNSAIQYLRKAYDIFIKIYGNDHSHTQMAISAMLSAEKFKYHSNDKN